MRLKKDYEVSLFIAGCILINYAGKALAEFFVLPVWLDSVGTVCAAYVWGPVCGAIVGAAVNLLYGIHSRTALYYGLTNVAVGVTVGICARKGYLKSAFGMMSTAFLVAIFSVMVSTPLNYLLAGGATGNLWGDGVAGLLQEMGCNAVLSHIVGEFYLDFLDKLITMLLLMLAVRLFRNKKKRVPLAVLLLLLQAAPVFGPADPVRAETVSGETEMSEAGENTSSDETERPEAGENASSGETERLEAGETAGPGEAEGAEVGETAGSGEVEGAEVGETAGPGEAERAEAGKTAGRERNAYQGYIRMVYDGLNGLPGGSASDIVQTRDGVLWVGTYGGLYRYNGNTFEWMKELESVKTVNCLYTDEDGRLWIGTNDNGLSICIDRTVSNVVKKADGMPSNSVRCIAENTQGYYYVGTAEGMVLLSLSSGLKVCGTIPEIVGAESLCADQDGTVVAVTEEGGLYLIRETQILAQKVPRAGGKVYTCCAFDQTGNLYAATSSGTVEIFQVTGGRFRKVSSIKCDGFGSINALHFSEEGRLFVCAENGAGYKDAGGSFFPIDLESFEGPVGPMLVDYQGNLWFTSAKSGLLGLCPSAFSEIYAESARPEDVVNSTAIWQGCLWLGRESGLAMPGGEAAEWTAPVLRALEGIAVRCLMTDSQDHLWVCTAGQGIFEIAPEGEIRQYDSGTGTAGDEFRCVTELRDGRIAAAGEAGIVLIGEHAVCGVIGAGEGLGSREVLSLYEEADGRLLAGTDGDGIAVIENGTVTGVLRQEDGLSSEVVLKMVPDSDGGGLFIVTGNGICYREDGKKIRVLDKFPYYNNYDLVQGKHGDLFVLSSAGIYVVDKEELLGGKTMKYELLDSRKGLRVSLTPGAWNTADAQGRLYLSGDAGAVSLDLDQYHIAARSYRMLLGEILADGERYPVEKGEVTRIPRGAGRIEIVPEVINYSVNDPDIQVYLEGFDREPKVMTLSGMSGVVYTNLPSGEYTFHLAVLDNRTGDVIAENTYQIQKEQEIYDNWWFRLYAGAMAVVIVSYLTWLFVRTQIQKTLRMQKMELEWAKSQLKMGNETILTIAEAVDAKDERTSQHSFRVSEYSVMIARKLGYGDEACEDLRKVAMLHDIGKIGIPDAVLNKPAPLTDEEYEIMKSHVKRGADILKNFTLIDHVADGALYHHERYDGSGYLYGLKGEEIPLNARIIGIADAFDAMTANRIYRRKLDIGFVLKEIEKGSGTQFDPKLVTVLLGLIRDGTIDVERIYGVQEKEEENEV